MTTKKSFRKIWRAMQYVLQQLFIVGTVGSLFLFVPLHSARLSMTRDSASAAKPPSSASRYAEAVKIVWLDQATSQGPGEKN